MIRSALTTAIVVMFAAEVAADVTRVNVTRRVDVGASAYEKIVGTIHFAIDPNDPANQEIVGLDKAPRNSSGKVEFSADLYILQPREAARSNGVALIDVVNRGRKTTLNGFSRGGTLDPATEADLGDGFLTRQGYTLVWVGWQFDVQRANNLMGIDAPRAMGVTTTVRAEFTPNDRNPDVTVTDLVGYPVLGDGSDASLTVRDGPYRKPQEIPRARFQLKGTVVSMPGGFEPGRTYQISYRTQDPAIAGVGLAAFRDTASWLKYDPSPAAQPRFTIAFGSSQSGRFLRTFLYQGFNTDEKGRRVFDGVIVHIAGAARLSINEEGATPNSLAMYSATAFPFSDTVQKDPVTGKMDGLLEKARARGHAPKVFHTNSSVEYWGGGRAAALTHVLLEPFGRDEQLPRNVRSYLFAGTQHSPGQFPPRKTAAQQLRDNPVQYWWSMRALLVAMTRWVIDDVEPPPNRYPMDDDPRAGYVFDVGTGLGGSATSWGPVNTLLPALFFARSELFPKIPGVQVPEIEPPGRDRRPERRLLVSRVDSDGNEMAGIRLPDISVPVATYTGWNLRSKEAGATKELVALIGSSIPFAPTKAQRMALGDPRRSVEERYDSKDDYLRRVRKAADDLVKDRYLLADDVAPIVARAGEVWDWVVAQK
jgi:hypothetical protein